MRRAVATILVFGILGAILNFTVVVGLVLLLPKPAKREIDRGLEYRVFPSGDSTEWEVKIKRSLTSEEILSWRRRSAVLSSFVPEVSQMPDLPGYACSLERPPADYFDGEVNFDLRAVFARGWPAMTMYFERDSIPRPGVVGVRGAVRIRTSTLGYLPPADYLPLRPIWPGFAINTLFYGVLLWLLFLAPFQWRRLIRKRRGRCPACGYPTGGSPRCTECGRVLKNAKPQMDADARG